MAKKEIDIDQERAKLQGDLEKNEADLEKMREDFKQMSIDLNELTNEGMEIRSKLNHLDKLEASV